MPILPPNWHEEYERQQRMKHYDPTWLADIEKQFREGEKAMKTSEAYYQYKTLHSDYDIQTERDLFDAELNRLSKDGWEPFNDHITHANEEQTYGDSDQFRTVSNRTFRTMTVRRLVVDPGVSEVEASAEMSAAQAYIASIPF